MFKCTYYRKWGYTSGVEETEGLLRECGLLYGLFQVNNLTIQWRTIERQTKFFLVILSEWPKHICIFKLTNF